jgi:hypothetical protein
MTRKGWRGRLTDDERAVLLWGAMLDGDEDVFPTKEALAAAWFANRADLLAAWAAGAEKDVPRSTMPYGYWAAESPNRGPVPPCRTEGNSASPKEAPRRGCRPPTTQEGDPKMTQKVHYLILGENGCSPGPCARR